MNNPKVTPELIDSIVKQLSGKLPYKFCIPDYAITDTLKNLIGMAIFSLDKSKLEFPTFSLKDADVARAIDNYYVRRYADDCLSHILLSRQAGDVEALEEVSDQEIRNMVADLMGDKEHTIEAETFTQSERYADMFRENMFNKVFAEIHATESAINFYAEYEDGYMANDIIEKSRANISIGVENFFLRNMLRYINKKKKN